MRIAQPPATGISAPYRASWPAMHRLAPQSFLGLSCVLGVIACGAPPASSQPPPSQPPRSQAAIEEPAQAPTDTPPAAEATNPELTIERMDIEHPGCFMLLDLATHTVREGASERGRV